MLSTTKEPNPLTSVLQEDPYTSLLALGGREMEQRPAVGVPYFGGVALLQHSADSAHIPSRHRSLDLQLLMQLRVPYALMVQHPVTFRKGNVLLHGTSGMERRREHDTLDKKGLVVVVVMA
jgi:hypothetical protein